MNTTQYFNRFFDEKTIDPDESFELTDKHGRWHLMTYGVVIESIKQTRGEEAEQLASMLRLIDYENGDVRHFLRFLGAGLASGA
jgi:hypothetical protein